MKPFQNKGGGNAKHTQKRRSTTTLNEIKQEVEAKDEPSDYVEMVDSARLRQQSSSTEASGVTNLACETGNEVYFELKEEIKSEHECTKKNSEPKRDACSSDGDGPCDGMNGENASKAGPSSISKGKNQKQKSKTSKRTDRTKQTNVKASKKAAVKRQKKHQCHLCNYAASFRSDLTRHIQIHTGEKPFECKQCAKSFAHKSGLVSHEKTHAPRFLRCSKCHYVFAQVSDKNEHEKQCQHHHFECYACKYITPQLQHMKTHMRIHSGIKPFECPVCYKMFVQKPTLFRHSRTHKKQLPFACTNCSQRFVDDSHKQSHEKLGENEHSRI